MSNEYDMMKEIEKNGPIVVNFKSSESFEFYRSGIYAKDNFSSWVYE